MIISYNKLNKKLLFLLIYLFIFLFSNSMALISAGGAYGVGGNDYYINYIVVTLVFFYLSFMVYFQNGHINFNVFSTPMLFYILLILFLTVVQLFIGVEFRSVMFTDIFLILLALIVFWFLYKNCTIYDVYSTINKAYLLFFIISLFLIFFVPSWGLSRNSTVWQGMFNQKNVLGLFCASYFIFLIIHLEHKKNKIVYLNMILSLILCFGSNSYTSFFCCVLSLFFIYFGKFFYKKISFILFIFSILFPFVIVYLSVGQFDFKILDKDFSFTDRDLIWKYSIENIYKSPIFGNGYSAIAYENGVDDRLFKYSVGFVANSAHNGYLGILYNYGVIGIISYFTMISIYFYKSFKLGYHGKYSIFIFLFTILNTFEDRLFGVNIVFLVFLIFTCYIDVYSKKYKA